MVTPKFN